MAEQLTWLQCGIKAIRALAATTTENRRTQGFHFQTEIWPKIKEMNLRGDRYGHTPHATLNQVTQFRSEHLLLPSRHLALLVLERSGIVADIPSLM
jgi:hypothetical protein